MLGSVVLPWRTITFVGGHRLGVVEAAFFAARSAGPLDEDPFSAFWAIVLSQFAGKFFLCFGFLPVLVWLDGFFAAVGGAVGLVCPAVSLAEELPAFCDCFAGALDGPDVESLWN